MYCSLCGASISSDSRICPECGADLEAFNEPSGLLADESGRYAELAEEAVASPVASYNSMSASNKTPEPASQAPKNKKTVLIVVASIAVVAALAGGMVLARGCGLFGGASAASMSDGAGEDEAAIGMTRVSFAVKADYYEESGSRLPVRISGTTGSGETVERIYYITINLAGAEPIELEEGDYTYEVEGSPISGNGVLYDFDGIGGSLTPEASAEDDGVAEIEIPVNLVPIDPLEYTDEMIEDAVEWAKGDEECADIADELGKAARDLRDEKIQQAEQEAAEEEQRKKAEAYQALCDAYEGILDNAPSYFDVYRGMNPDGNYAYYLTDVTGDGISELFLMGHYGASGVGGSSGHWRILPFVYDADAGAITVATAAGDAWDLYVQDFYSHEDKANHQLVCCSVETTMPMDSMYDYTSETYYRVWIEGTQLMREQISSDAFYACNDCMTISERAMNVNDSRYLDHMRQYDNDWQPEYDYECEWFAVDVIGNGDPSNRESWTKNWQMCRVDENLWRLDSFGHEEGYSPFSDGGSQFIYVYFGDQQPVANASELVGSSYTQDGTPFRVYKATGVSAPHDIAIYVK